jgi:hypothetical protein
MPRISDLEAEIERKRKRGQQPSQRDIVLLNDARKQQEAALMYGQTSSPFSGSIPQATSAAGGVGQSQLNAKADHGHPIGTHGHADSTSGGTIVSTGVSDFNEAAQDAVGTILTDTTTIDFTYDDATPKITADVKPLGIKLDDLGTPDNNTDLNVTATYHGLCPMFPNNTTTFLRGDGTYAAPTATVADGSITLAKLADLSATTYGVVIGRRATPAGVPESLSITPSGGITADASAGAFNIYIANGGVTLAKMANLDPDYFIGRQTNSNGVPEAIGVAEQRLVGRITGGHIDDLTVTQVKALIGNVTDVVPGLCPTHPNDAAKFLRGDATWTTLPVAAGAIPLQPAADIVVNDTGEDWDWRWETDTNATFLNIDSGTSVLSLGVAPAALDAGLTGMFQVTAPATTHVASFHSVSAGYGVYVTNSVAEATNSGGVIAVQAGIVPSAADKRVGVYAFRGLTAAGTSAQCATISAHSSEAWSAGVAGTYVRFNVAPTGSATAAEVFRVANTVITLADAKDIAVGTTTGTKIGTATSQKLGFYNATPVVQQAHIADPTGGVVVDTQCRAQLALLLAWQATMGFTAAA